MKKFFMIMAVAAICAGFTSCGGDKKGCDDANCPNKENCTDCTDCNAKCGEKECTGDCENCPNQCEQSDAQTTEVEPNQVAEGLSQN